MSEKKNRIVFVDSQALSEKREKILGRPLAKIEEKIINMVDAIQIDALACGRTVAETVNNIEKNGGEISGAVKSALGLLPPVN